MAPEAFVLSPCTAIDVPALADVYLTAFASNPFNHYTFPRSTIGEEEMYRWLTDRFTKLFLKREIRVFKISEVTTGKVVAFCRWLFPIALTDEEKAEREREKKQVEEERKEGRDSTWPTGANLEICDLKFGALGRMTDKYVVKEEMYVAQILATDPAYQGKGLATRLMRHVLDIADAEGRKAYIEATKAGYPLYLKLGFKEIDAVVVDLSKWGAKEKGLNTIMLRDPHPLKQGP